MSEYSSLEWKNSGGGLAFTGAAVGRANAHLRQCDGPNLASANTRAARHEDTSAGRVTNILLTNDATPGDGTAPQMCL